MNSFNSFSSSSAAIKYIRDQRMLGRSWESLKLKENEGPAFFSQCIQFGWPDDIEKKWLDLIEQEYLDECNRRSFEFFTSECHSNSTPDQIIEIEKPSLTFYIEKLREDGIDTSNIEKDCKNVLYKIHNGIQSGKKTQRGLILGMPRSSKTVSSLGIMSLAADIGWNLFIIITGYTNNYINYHKRTIKNRINLVNKQYKWSVLTVEDLDYTNAIHSSENNDLRHVIIAPRRESDLINLKRKLQNNNHSPKDTKMIIFDEDVYRIGTDVTRFRGKLEGVDRITASIINDIQYPYVAYLKISSNVTLQFDKEWHPRSLFPCDFIYALEDSKQYYGPAQIFDDGSVRPINIVKDMDLQMAIFFGKKEKQLSASMNETLIWLICTLAIARKRGIIIPLTSLFLCTTRRDDRKLTIESIERFFTIGYEKNKPLIKKVYEKELHKEIGLCEIRYEQIEQQVKTIIDAGIVRNDSDQKEHDGIILCTDYLTQSEPDPDVPPFPDYQKNYKKANGYLIVGGYSLKNGTAVKNVTSVMMSDIKSFSDSMFSIDFCCIVKKDWSFTPHLWISTQLYDHLKKAYVTEMIIRNYVIENQVSRIIDLPENYSKLIEQQKFDKNKIFQAYEENYCDQCGCTIAIGDTCCRSDNPRYTIVCYNCYSRGKEERQAILDTNNERADEIIKMLFEGKKLDEMEIDTNSQHRRVILRIIQRKGIYYDIGGDKKIYLADCTHVQAFVRSILGADSKDELYSIFEEYKDKWVWIVNQLISALNKKIDDELKKYCFVNYTENNNVNEFIPMCSKLREDPNIHYFLTNQYKYRRNDNEGKVWKMIDQDNKYAVFRQLVYSILDGMYTVNRYEDSLNFNGNQYYIQIVMDSNDYYAISEDSILITIDFNGIYCIGDNMEKVNIFDFFDVYEDDYLHGILKYACALYRCWND